MRATPLWLIRLAGMTVVGLLGCFLLFGVWGKTDISWALPWKKMAHLRWPDLPFFSSWKTTAPDGREEVIYRVPTRQLSRDEIVRLKYQPATNAPPTASR